VLHHPEYRARYAENLKRELPRISLVKDSRAFAKAGKELADLHVNYETVEPYPLKDVETAAPPRRSLPPAPLREGEGSQELKDFSPLPEGEGWKQKAMWNGRDPRSL
jgi:hypothetical protein